MHETRLADSKRQTFSKDGQTLSPQSCYRSLIATSVCVVTTRVKRQGMKDGEQFVPNTPKAKQAAKKYLD